MQFDLCTSADQCNNIILTNFIDTEKNRQFFWFENGWNNKQSSFCIWEISSTKFCDILKICSIIS